MFITYVLLVEAGFHDMPPMDVSGKSFQLDSRSRNAEANKEAEQSREKPSRLPPPPALGAKLFDVLDNSANRYGGISFSRLSSLC